MKIADGTFSSADSCGRSFRMLLVEYGFRTAYAGCTIINTVAQPPMSRNIVARGGRHMAWTTPTLVEICIGLEINGYLPAEF
jgi:coenzyme PQQ precursor peptide PqqA